MKKLIFILTAIFVCTALCVAQEVQEQDSTFSHDPVSFTAEITDAGDTIYLAPDTNAVRVVDEEPPIDESISRYSPQWKPNPNRAVWIATIIPSAGQIYNKSYWKLPIVYGGFFGCAYAITWNNRMYSDYKTAYRDIMTDTHYSETDPSKSYVAILPNGYTIERLGGKTKYTQTLQNRQNTYRRYRDISIVATILVYALSIIDAFVDAQLYDFDISTDLSLDTQPQIYYDMMGNHSTQIQVAIRF